MGESPENQYIITVSGRGYQLAERAQTVPQHDLEILAGTRSTVELQVEEGKPRRWIYLLTIGTSILAIAIIVIYFVLRRTPHLTEKDAVVIAEFSNSTGDPIFDEALRQGMAGQLALRFSA